MPSSAECVRSSSATPHDQVLLVGVPRSAARPSPCRLVIVPPRTGRQLKMPRFVPPRALFSRRYQDIRFFAPTVGPDVQDFAPT
jgi:transposase